MNLSRSAPWDPSHVQHAQVCSFRCLQGTHIKSPACAGMCLGKQCTPQISLLPACLTGPPLNKSHEMACLCIQQTSTSRISDCATAQMPDTFYNSFCTKSNPRPACRMEVMTKPMSFCHGPRPVSAFPVCARVSSQVGWVESSHHPQCGQSDTSVTVLTSIICVITQTATGGLCFCIRKMGQPWRWDWQISWRPRSAAQKSTIPCLSSCLLLGPQRLEAEKLQTWIFQLMARCSSQSKADMEKQTIVGYIKKKRLFIDEKRKF